MGGKIMSKQKLVDCKCGGKAEAIQDGPWYIRCVECGKESIKWAYRREAVKSWRLDNEQ
jgi:hypothetical protein